MKLFLIFLLINLSNALSDLIKIDLNSFDTLNIPIYDGTYKIFEYEKEFDEFNCERIVNKFNSLNSEINSILLSNCEKLIKIKLQDPLYDFCERTSTNSLIKILNISNYYNEPSSLLLFTYPMDEQLLNYNFYIKQLINKLRLITLNILNFNYYFNLKNNEFLDEFLNFFDSNNEIKFKNLATFEYCKFNRNNLKLSIYLNRPNIDDHKSIVKPKLIDFMIVNDYNNDLKYNGPNLLIYNNLINKFCELRSISIGKILKINKFYLKDQCLKEDDYLIDNFEQFYTEINIFNELKSIAINQNIELTYDDYDLFRNQKNFKIEPFLNDEIYRIYCRSFTIHFKDNLDRKIQCPNYVFEISMRNKFFIYNRYISFNEEKINDKIKIFPVIVEFV